MSLIVACAVIHRDGYRCAYCDKPNLAIKTNVASERAELDHILPRKDGGLSIATNLVTSCGFCNRKRQSNKVDPVRILGAITKAHVPIDRDVGRRLASIHYPSRMKLRAKSVS